MNSLLSYAVAVAKGLYLFELDSDASDSNAFDSQKGAEVHQKSPSTFKTIPHDSYGHNKCYEALYILLNYLQYVINFFMFLVLVQHLGIQMVNIFGILYCFQEIVVLAPVYAMSRVAHVSLTRLMQGEKPLSFVAYSWAYILLSIIISTLVAVLCTIFRDIFITYLLGDMAPWCIRVYMVSIWINATVVTIATCMQHILMVEERSVILLGALAVREFTKIFVFVIYIFYLCMPMVRSASYWTGELNGSAIFPTSEFYHDGLLRAAKPSDVASATTMKELMSLLSPHHILQGDGESSKLMIMKIHLYSYHISILLSSCAFILVSACLVACRTRTMGWVSYKKDPIVVSCIPFTYGLILLLSDINGLCQTVKHFVISWIPVYLDKISILVPLISMCVASRRKIMATERSTLTLMQLTLFRVLYDAFNSLSISTVELFTAKIIRLHADRAYKKEVLTKRRVVFLCIFLSILCYPIMVKLNRLVLSFKQFNYDWLTPIEKLWIDEIYEDSGPFIMQYVSNIFIGVHILLVMHLLMDQKIVSIYLLSVVRFFFFFMLIFSSSRSPRLKYTSVQELAISNIITSLISVLGLILGSSKYNIS